MHCLWLKVAAEDQSGAYHSAFSRGQCLHRSSPRSIPSHQSRVMSCPRVQRRAVEKCSSWQATGTAPQTHVSRRIGCRVHRVSVRHLAGTAWAQRLRLARRIVQNISLTGNRSCLARSAAQSLEVVPAARRCDVRLPARGHSVGVRLAGPHLYAFLEYTPKGCRLGPHCRRITCSRGGGLLRGSASASLGASGQA